jgi:hypothetical protein
LSRSANISFHSSTLSFDFLLSLSHCSFLSFLAFPILRIVFDSFSF